MKPKIPPVSFISDFCLESDLVAIRGIGDLIEGLDTSDVIPSSSVRLFDCNILTKNIHDHLFLQIKM